MENSTSNTSKESRSASDKSALGKRNSFFMGRFKFKKAIPFFILLLIIIVIVLPLSYKIKDKKEALVLSQSKEQGTDKALTNVITFAPQPSRITEKISFPGIVKPWISLQVVAEIRGKIVDKRLMKGQQVHRGDVLAIIDKTDYQNAYNAALAAYETAQATERRLRSLMKNNFSTRSQFDEAIAQLKIRKAELDNAQIQLDRCTILSPMEGIVDQTFIEKGTFLNPGDPVALILQIDKVKVFVGIPESDVNAVRKLTSFGISFDSLDGKSCTGEYYYLHKTTSSLARLYDLEIKVDNPEREILPDMFARVNIVKNDILQGLAVPTYSLVNANKQTGLYIEKDGFVHFRPVKTGFSDQWKTQIAGGLDPGDNVVVVGHRIIEDGEKVNVTKTIRNMEELSKW
jgi:membrane fusion protein, multidrug efflux system